MGFGKFLAGTIGVVGAVVLAPVVLPAAASVGISALAVGSTVATAASTAVATGATAIASTAVGSAAIAGMTAVGTGVGAVAGAAGLTSVATVAGTATGAAALGTIATSGVVAASSTIYGTGKMKEADELKNDTDWKLDNANKRLKKSENDMNHSLEVLGENKKEIWIKLDKFIEECSKIRNIPEHGDLSEEGSITFDKIDIDKMKEVTFTVNDAIVGGVASLSGGALIGFATATGFTSIATASTGTAIAGLHGIAASNASLAALGGGALSTGGLGMAGGMVVANALAFAPALAIGGLLIGSKGSKKLESAKDYSREVNRFIQEANAAISSMNQLRMLSDKICNALNSTKNIFDGYFEKIMKITSKTYDFKLFSKTDQIDFYISVKMAKILTDLVCTELIEEKTLRIKTDDVEKKITECRKEVSKFAVI